LSEARNFLISRITVNVWNRTLPHGLGYNSWTDKYWLNPKTENATHIVTYTSMVCEGLLSIADCISVRHNPLVQPVNLVAISAGVKKQAGKSEAPYM
jgi:hypothetical protein